MRKLITKTIFKPYISSLLEEKAAHVGLTPDSLKIRVRDALLALTWAERVEFIYTLEAELTRMRVDISGVLPFDATPESISPTEIGHIFRYVMLSRPDLNQQITALAGAIDPRINSSIIAAHPGGNSLEPEEIDLYD
jgi:hypothetical protein